MSTKQFCDRCLREITDNMKTYRLEVKAKGDDEKDIFALPSMDLCPFCKEELKKWCAKEEK